MLTEGVTDNIAKFDPVFQVKLFAPIAVKLTGSPAHEAFVPVILITGNGFTVIVKTALVANIQPKLLVPVTE